jgi:ParB family chromosome partitioning protein
MTFQTIPLDKLVLAESNVRRTAVEINLEELAASIAVHGILQNLSVRALLDPSGEPTGRYEVVAGGRRLRALKRLARTKTIKKNHPVPCMVIGGFSDTEIGLAENLYCPMHPADQYEAWARLAAEGQSPADIAARFGVSEHVVQQRLRLGKVSPRLLDLYRDGVMKLDTLMAFTLSDDHEEQERVWAELPEWNRNAEMVRRYLTKAHVAASEPIVRLVGLEAYEGAGGRVLRDLFDERRTWLLDRDILDRLAADKLEAEAETVRAEGWKWVQVGFDYPQDFGGRRRIYPVTRELTAEEVEERAKLEVRLEEIAPILDGSEKDDTLAAEADDIERRLTEIESACHAFTPEQKAIAGATVWLDTKGDVGIDRGLVRREDDRPAEPVASPDGDATGAEPEGGEAETPALPGPDGPATTPEEPQDEPLRPLSDALVEELTAYRTAGLRLALARDPETALIALTHALACRLFHPAWRYGSCLDVRPTEPYLTGSAAGIRENTAFVAFEAERARWGAQLPDDAQALWDWLAAAGPRTRQELLAFCTAASVNAVVKAHGYGNGPSTFPPHAHRLAASTRLDMTEHWSPSRDRWLGRVSKRHILAAVAEAAGAEKARQLDGLKKDALIELAEPILTEARWLPDMLRTPAAETAESPTEDADGGAVERSTDAEESAPAEGSDPGEPYPIAAE